MDWHPQMRLPAEHLRLRSGRLIVAQPSIEAVAAGSHKPSHRALIPCRRRFGAANTMPGRQSAGQASDWVTIDV